MTLSGRLDAWLERYGQWVVRNRLYSLLAFVLITVGIGWTSSQRVVAEGVPVDFTPQAMFLNDGPEVQAQRRAEAIFGVEDTTLALMVEGDLRSESSIAYLKALQDILESAPRVERVDSVVSAQVNIGEGWIEMVHPLDELPPTEALDLIGEDPLFKGVLLSEDQQLTVFRVRLDEMEEIAILGPAVREVVARAESIELSLIHI